MSFKTKTIYILAYRTGDHCNRLFQSIHYHAHCLENGYHFFNPTLVGMLNNRGLLLDQTGDFFHHFFTYFGVIIRFFVYLFQNSFLSRFFSINIVGGWDFRSHQLTTKYRQELSNTYSLSTLLSDRERSFLSSLNSVKQNGSIILGVHVRRGDYSTWKGGIYFFNDDFYRKHIESLRLEFSSLGKSVYVIVCSNDSSPPNCGEDFLCQRSWYVDQLCLQQCDYIVGPPSTFTLWASYVASIPYVHIVDKNQRISLSSFTICGG